MGIKQLFNGGKINAEPKNSGRGSSNPIADTEWLDQVSVNIPGIIFIFIFSTGIAGMEPGFFKTFLTYASAIIALVWSIGRALTKGTGWIGILIQLGLILFSIPVYL
jgi:hypothetical protein